MTRTPIMIGGAKIGRFRASKLLFKESFRFLRADAEMLWFPVLAFVAQCFFVGLFVFAVVGGYIFVEEGTQQEKVLGYVVLFGMYLIGAFFLSFSQAGIAHIVFTRLHGGDATFGEALRVVDARIGQIFVWSLITSTVGMVLNMIAERSRLLGKIVVWLLGAAWSILTYFVVQGIVLDRKGAIEAVRHSASVFRKTWGETLVTNISLGLVFLLAHLLAIAAAIGLIVVGFSIEGGEFLMVAVGALYLVWVFGAVLLASSLDSVLRTLLYVYASDHTVPTNFNRELLDQMLARKGVTGGVAPAAATPPIV